MTDNIITTTNVANSPGGVLIPQKITKLDAVVFSNLLMRCRSLDVGRRIQQHQKLDRSEIDIIARFCIQSIEDVHRMERDGRPKGKEVVS